jgi:hypothetical protein
MCFGGKGAEDAVVLWAGRCELENGGLACAKKNHKFGMCTKRLDTGAHAGPVWILPHEGTLAHHLYVCMYGVNGAEF